MSSAPNVSLGHGRHLVSIPGPSVIPDRVLNAMHRAMPNIYEGALVELSTGILNEISAIPRTAGHGFIAITNGHGAWDMALANTLSRGDKVLVLESGRFATGWGEQAAAMGIEVEIQHAPPRRAVDPTAVEERLRADKAHEITAILVVQIDTASSVWNDIAAIRKAIDVAGHPALYMVDCIASLGCVPYEMDEWGVDVTVGGSQKGLMVPPGLGFTWANDKAMAAHQNAGLRTSYWDWTKRITGESHYWRYHGTPPISHLYALREALDMIAEEG
ncbi:MAG: pyridoxal-phosphate-dependent aminotransferase family protein, partial [Paracoccaceae bacterium]